MTNNNPPPTCEQCGTTMLDGSYCGFYCPNKDCKIIDPWGKPPKVSTKYALKCTTLQFHITPFKWMFPTFEKRQGPFGPFVVVVFGPFTILMGVY